MKKKTSAVFLVGLFLLNVVHALPFTTAQPSADPIPLDCPEFWEDLYYTKYNCGAEGYQFTYDAQGYVTKAHVWTTQNDNTAHMYYELVGKQTNTNYGQFSIRDTTADNHAMKWKVTPVFCNALTGTCLQSQPNWFNNMYHFSVQDGSCDTYYTRTQYWREGWIPSSQSGQTLTFTTYQGEHWHYNYANYYTLFEDGIACVSFGVKASDQMTGRWYAKRAEILLEE